MTEQRDVTTRTTYFENKPVHPERFIHGSTLPAQVVEDDRQQLVEDDRTGMSVEAIQKAFLDHLNYSRGTELSLATPNDLYIALSLTVRDRLMHRWIASRNALHDGKMVCYLSAEFLLGRQLSNNLLNIGAFMQTRRALEQLGLNFYDILEQEAEPGLGNGGLGRLAACFLDSLSTLEVPAIGYGIRYEFGIFEQAIENGWQVERPDNWLRFGNPWELARPQLAVEVGLGGHVEVSTDQHGRSRRRWLPAHRLLGVPYDTMIPGYGTNLVNTLRLWSAGTTRDFDFQIFHEGDYTRAVSGKIGSETISKVLYPNDDTPQGRELRLKQQFFFVSSSLQDMIRRHLRRSRSVRNIHELNAIQLNDTHPSIGVAELMRLLVDEHLVDWDTAWQITSHAFSYTNHTLLPEALETWPVGLLGHLLPRHLEIIYEINRRFLEVVQRHFPGDGHRTARMSLIEEGPVRKVRMAHLATVGSHAVNGVAELHTQLLKDELLRDFRELWPEKFSNKTNGVTPRRWLMLCNPKLSFLISESIGRGWIKDLGELRKLEAFADNLMFQETWRSFKEDNKRDVAEYVLHYTGLEVDPDSLFDIQVKRLHEYKRQLLNVLHVVHLYNRLKAQPDLSIPPRTFIFGGKAAPGYRMAKLIIKLIHAVADVINADQAVNQKIKVVFIPNFSVSLGERIYPAADLSEQISLAGKEASGTGNMKFALNGALTVGTLDGANIEIREAVGTENFFHFGLTADQVRRLKQQGYTPRLYYDQNPDLRAVIDLIASGYFSEAEPDLFRPLTDSLMHQDEYLLFADFPSYVECQERIGQVFGDQPRWTKMCILNVARMGRFSSDRTIGEYCEQIWRAKPIHVPL